MGLVGVVGMVGTGEGGGTGRDCGDGEEAQWVKYLLFSILRPKFGSLEHTSKDRMTLCALSAVLERPRERTH